MRAAVLALVLAGCYSPSPAVGIPCSPEGRCPDGQTCDMTKSPPVCISSLVDASIDVPDAFEGCMTNDDCTALTSPVCDPATHSCRGCVADAECGGVCTEYNGECLADSRAVFLSATGNDGSNNCMRSMPCRTWGRVATEINTTKRTVVLLDGAFSSSGSPVLSIGTLGGRIVVSGEDNNPDGAFVTAMSNGTTNPQVVNVASNTDIVLEGFTIRNGGNDGLRNFGDLLLYRMAITGNSGAGVSSNVSNNAALHIWESTITGNTQEGINAQKGPVEILRSYIAHNTQVGIFISQCATTIKNTFIVRNGMTAPYGAIRMQQLNGLPQDLAFLTIAYNTASNANIAGLNADQTVSITSSILVENNNAATGVEQICSGCTATYSMFSSTTVPIGQGNIAGPASFVDIAMDDFHLTAASAAKDAADGASTTLIDYDGNTRPAGTGFDMGADELPP